MFAFLLRDFLEETRKDEAVERIIAMMILLVFKNTKDREDDHSNLLVKIRWNEMVCQSNSDLCRIRLSPLTLTANDCEIA